MGEEDTRSDPSFFQDDHHRAHLGQEHHNQIQIQHLHLHHQVHKRQAETISTTQSVITEVVATVSFLQQIDVDSTGSTFSVLTLLASPTVSLTDSSSQAIPTSAAASSGASSTQPLSATASQSLNSTSTEASSALTSTPSAPTSSFPSFTASSNSTTLITSSSSLPVAAVLTFSNSSTTSSTSSLSSSSTSSLTSSLSSSTSSLSSSTSSTSSLYSPISSSNSPSSTGAAGGVGGTGVASGGAASSSAASGNGSNSSNVSTPKVVGGVLGGLAGLALIGFLLLFIIKWYRRKQSMLPLGNGTDGTGNDQVRDAPPSQPGPSMSQRRSTAFVPAALANLTGYNKRASAKTDRTASSTAGSERGFYRVSGRKLPSVLQSGGDGYGGGVHDSTLSGSSFYQDSTGFYGGPGSPPTMSSPLGPERDSGIPVMRPSPARTPVTEHGPFAPSMAPPTPTLTPPRRPDALGRSRPSQDGSHGSRFTEEV